MPQRFPWRLVTVDIDGTLTIGHGWREIARAFGRLTSFEATNRRFFAHEISEDAHLTNLLDIATGHSVREVEEVLAGTPKLEGISEGVARLRKQGARVALLTHNPTYVAEWYERTFRFDGAQAVAAQSVDHGLIGPPTGPMADKPEGLRALLSRWDVPAGASVHIGDGWSDVLVFRLVGGGVALNSRLPEVNAAADLALTTRDFRDVSDAVSRLEPRA